VSGNTPRHNKIRDRLLSRLMAWAEAQAAGEVISEQEYDFLGNAHGPDVSFFGPEKQVLLDLDKRVQRFVPDLAIEVASASDTYDSLLRKKETLLDLYKRVQRFVPDLAIEVASASDTYDSLLRKKERYRRAGTTEVWLISAENAEIAIYGPDRDRILRAGDTLSSEVLPGFAIAVNDLFRGL